MVETITARKPLFVNLMFHFHQPPYSAVGDKKIMPWVRVHAVNEYYGFAKMMEQHPKMKATFNFSPSLLEQINEYSGGRPPEDVFERKAVTPVRYLAGDDRQFIKDFFIVDNKLARENSRYSELLNRMNAIRAGGKGDLNDKEISDLQALFHLIWFHPEIRQNDEDVRYLVEKKYDFTAEDKAAIFRLYNKYTSMVIPQLKKVNDAGIVELTTSPFYHPILPLLCNIEVARDHMPWLRELPTFAYPEDSRRQIASGLSYFKDTFGKYPSGMWPSEGSVSDAVIPQFADEGAKWIATGQKNLLFSLAYTRGRPTTWDITANELYSPWNAQVNGRNLPIVFRDDMLSDKIGFKYKDWEAKDAVEDFFSILKNIRVGLEKDPGSLGERPGMVTIILDGENPWEYYPNRGIDFLHKLFSRLENNDDSIVPTNTTEYLAEYGVPEGNVLEKLSPGSWVRGQFDIWIGSKDANRAWEMLANARQVISGFDSDVYARAWKSFHKAEASDFMWWYGGSNYTSHYRLFDNLFRLNLISMYTELGKSLPEDLSRPLMENAQAFGGGAMQSS